MAYNSQKVVDYSFSHHALNDVITALPQINIQIEQQKTKGTNIFPIRKSKKAT
jgi:hypothetical protein